MQLNPVVAGAGAEWQRPLRVNAVTLTQRLAIDDLASWITVRAELAAERFAEASALALDGYSGRSIADAAGRVQGGRALSSGASFEERVARGTSLDRLARDEAEARRRGYRWLVDRDFIYRDWRVPLEALPARDQEMIERVFLLREPQNQVAQRFACDPRTVREHLDAGLWVIHRWIVAHWQRPEHPVDPEVRRLILLRLRAG